MDNKWFVLQHRRIWDFLKKVFFKKKLEKTLFNFSKFLKLILQVFQKHPVFLKIPVFWQKIVESKFFVKNLALTIQSVAKRLDRQN